MFGTTELKIYICCYLLVEVRHPLQFWIEVGGVFKSNFDVDLSGRTHSKRPRSKFFPLKYENSGWGIEPSNPILKNEQAWTDALIPNDVSLNLSTSKP